jgi:hypothetical protein
MSATASCRTCRHFSDSAPAIEAAMPGLASLSSAYAAVRSDDGVCGVHHRLIGAAWSCGDHAPRRAAHALGHGAATSHGGPLISAHSLATSTRQS